MEKESPYRENNAQVHPNSKTDLNLRVNLVNLFCTTEQWKLDMNFKKNMVSMVTNDHFYDFDD